MKTYAGIDLHSSNNFVGIIDEQDKRLYKKRLPNRMDDILTALSPFKETLEGVMVESTYNWWMDWKKKDTRFIWQILRL